MPRDHGFQTNRIDGRDRFEPSTPLARTQYKFRSDLGADAASEVWTRCVVDGHRDHSAKRAPKKCRHPFGAVWIPQQHRIALADVARSQFASELIRYTGNAPIAPALVPVAARKHI